MEKRKVQKDISLRNQEKMLAFYSQNYYLKYKFKFYILLKIS